MNQPTPIDVFEDRTALIVRVIFDGVLRETNTALTAEHYQWLLDYFSWRVRYLHANNPVWRAWLEGKRMKRMHPVAQLEVWFRHWLTAFKQDSRHYILTHREGFETP
jgi:hypothetical protein